MRFDATLVGLVFSAIGTLVVVVGAIAAVWQLRYIRHGNELATLTQLDEEFSAPDMIRATEFVRFELADSMRDAAFVADLRSARATAGAQSVLKVADFFELMGVYLHYGALSEDMTLTIWGVIVSRYWTLMREAVEQFRSERTVLRFFEDFAVRSDRWLASKRFRDHLDRLATDDTPRLPTVDRPSAAAPREP